jgi:O-acetyl-ADP-ribose deacetylase (regulator of RNase III)
MITYKTGDLLLEDVDALVNAVNCVGIMGRGIALQFKKKFPQNYVAYEKACNEKEIVPGRVFVHETGSLLNPRLIINFPTKRHWRNPSLLEDIEAGLKDLVRVIRDYHIQSIALPPLGCGLGGLSWNSVRALMENWLGKLSDVHIVIFKPVNTPYTSKICTHPQKPNMTSGRAALVDLIQRYLSALLDPLITLLEVHKLLYFLQESGEKLSLHYRKAPYGPYAENLRHVLHAIEGHFLTGYADGGDEPNKQLHLLPGAYENALDFLKRHEQTKIHLDRVSSLVEGFESPFGMELLATVHWVVTKENAKTIDQAINLVYNWNERKKQFNTRQIELAFTVLTSKGWIE